MQLCLHHALLWFGGNHPVCRLLGTWVKVSWPSFSAGIPAVQELHSELSAEKLAEMEVTSPLKGRGVCIHPCETACINFRLYRALCTNLSGYWATASGSEENTVVLPVSTSELLNCLYTYSQLLSNPSADTTSFSVCVKGYSHHLWKENGNTWLHLVKVVVSKAQGFKHSHPCAIVTCRWSALDTLQPLGSWNEH